MGYSFDIIGVAPAWNFFKHQQQVEKDPHRSRAYLGSYRCTLDSFIEATQLVYQKPAWDWDAVVNQIVAFWLKHEARIRHWQDELNNCTDESLIVARVTNFQTLRQELESLFTQE